MSSTIQIRVEDELKVKSDALFKELGTDTTTAIRIFLTQAIANNGFPFEIKKHFANPFEVMSEADIMSKLETSRQQAILGEITDAKKVAENLRKKYGV